MDVWKLRGKVSGELFKEWEDTAAAYRDHLGLLPAVVRGEHEMTPEEWKKKRDELKPRQTLVFGRLLAAAKEAGIS